MKKTLPLFMAFLMAATIGLTACQSKAADTSKNGTPAAKEPQELTINLVQEVGTLDWQGSSSSAEIGIYNIIMEGLTRATSKGQVKPGIAEKWEVSPDGKVWTFHLRDAKWQDGKSITAGDFKYGWMRALDPKTPRDYTYFLYDIANAEEYSSGKTTEDKVGIKVIDDKTLEVTLKQPVTYFDYLVSFITYAPARKDIVEKYGEKYNTEAEGFMVNGPFILKSWTHESEMVFTRNPQYWDTSSIKLDKITGLMITDSSTEFNMYEAGDLDTTNELSAEQKLSLTKGAVKNYATGRVVSFGFNCDDPILKNAKIRKALTYSIDRKSFIDNVVKQPWKAALAFVQPDVIPDADGKTMFRDKKPAYFKDNDAATAKTLLADGMKELGLTKLPEFEFLCNDNSNDQRNAQAFQEMWKKNLGVIVKVVAVPTASRISREHKHDYQISLGGWGPDYPDPMTDLDLYVTGAGNNDVAYSNPEYDSLLKTAKAELDKNKKFELMRKAEDLLMNDMPMGPLYFQYRDYAVREYVKNYDRDAFNDIPVIYAHIEGRPAKQ